MILMVIFIFIPCKDKDKKSDYLERNGPLKYFANHVDENLAKNNRQ